MHFPAGLVFLCALVSSAVALPHQYGMNAPRDWKGTPCNGTEKLCPEGFKCSWNKFCYSDLFSCQDANGSRLCHIEQSFCGNDTEICFTRKCEFDRDCPEGLLCGELGSCMFPSCEDGKCPGDFTCVEAQPDLLSCVRRRPTVGTPGELAPENLPVINHVCWPAHARVELESGRRVPMHTLALGDNVRVGPTSFSPVFMFTHRVADVVAEFVTLSTDVGTSVTLTPGHYIYANGQMVAARQVMPIFVCRMRVRATAQLQSKRSRRCDMATTEEETRQRRRCRLSAIQWGLLASAPPMRMAPHDAQDWFSSQIDIVLPVAKDGGCMC